MPSSSTATLSSRASSTQVSSSLTGLLSPTMSFPPDNGATMLPWQLDTYNVTGHNKSCDRSRKQWACYIAAKP